MAGVAEATLKLPSRRFSAPQQVDSLAQFGFYCALVAQLPWFCFIFDRYLAVLHLPMLSMLGGLLAAFATGRLMQSVQAMPGRAYVFISIWMCMGVPFSFWPGGTFALLKGTWLVTIITFFVVISNITTKEQVRLSLTLLTLGAGFSGLMAPKVGGSVWGRLALKGSRFGDPNDLALLCVIAIPLLGFMVMNRGHKYLRIAAGVMLPITLYTFLKTGSRGGVLGLAAVALFFFWKVGMANKAKLVAAGVVGILLLPVVIKDEDLLQRLTMIGKEADQSVYEQGGMAVGAADSAQARWELLMRSLEVTGRNPLFGVGMGNFMMVDHEMSVERGASRGAWHVTHNMYTQWSSEIGIPGLALLVYVLIFTWRNLTKLEKYSPPSMHPEERREYRHLAVALKTTMMGYMASAMFLGVAYVAQLPVLVAIIHIVYVTHVRDAARVPSAARQNNPVAPGRRMPVFQTPVPKNFPSPGFESGRS